MGDKITFNPAARREVPDFPTEVTFKAIYHNSPHLTDMLNNIFAENNIAPHVNSKTSKNGKFISYTVTAFFQSEEQLKKVCANASSIEGFTTMF